MSINASDYPAGWSTSWHSATVSSSSGRWNQLPCGVTQMIGTKYPMEYLITLESTTLFGSSGRWHQTPVLVSPVPRITSFWGSLTGRSDCHSWVPQKRRRACLFVIFRVGHSLTDTKDYYLCWHWMLMNGSLAVCAHAYSAQVNVLVEQVPWEKGRGRRGKQYMNCTLGSRVCVNWCLEARSSRLSQGPALCRSVHHVVTWRLQTLAGPRGHFHSAWLLAVEGSSSHHPTFRRPGLRWMLT